VGEGKAPIRYRHADRLVAEIETGQRAAAREECGKFLDRDDVGRNGGFP
jgi:hypothetical protein